MTRTLPTDDEVRHAMHLVLREAAEAGRRPTVTAVERRLGTTHPTFYRTYPDLIDWFKQQARHSAAATGPAATARSDTAKQLASVRRDNEDLRRRIRIYAEALRQLTIDHAQLQADINAQAGVADLDTHRRQRTTDRAEHPT
jgi:hypothetical protein